MHEYPSGKKKKSNAPLHTQNYLNSNNSCYAHAYFTNFKIHHFVSGKLKIFKDHQQYLFDPHCKTI